MDLLDGLRQRRGPRRQADRGEPLEPAGVQLGGRLDVQRGLAPLAAAGGQLARVVRVAAADDHDRVDPIEQPLEGALVLLGRQADRVDEPDLGVRVPRDDRGPDRAPRDPRSSSSGRRSPAGDADSRATSSADSITS